jgi:hypothetical protein
MKLPVLATEARFVEQQETYLVQYVYLIIAIKCTRCNRNSEILLKGGTYNIIVFWPPHLANVLTSFLDRSWRADSNGLFNFSVAPILVFL